MSNPIVVNSVPEVLVKFGVYFLYRIPNNTFYDEQDGWTENLQLSLTDDNRKVGVCSGVVCTCAISSSPLIFYLNN